MSNLNDEIKEKSLEYWLSRATDPFSADQNRHEAARAFYEQVNQELEGQLVACRLLAHKIQSPHEKEALNALEVLDACVRNCGQRFHNEIAKFKFLNEIIKILSPKYLGNQTSENVKKKAIEALYSWKMTLKHLPKIKQAYDMLKEQGIVTQDPSYVVEIFEPLPAKPKLATFEDDEKAKLLSQLLKSKNPDDIQAANRLIKSMVKAEDQKMEKMSKRGSDLTKAGNNAKLLQEMLQEFDRSTTMQQEIEIMKELADSLVKLRPALFRYAGESSENDEEVLAEILNVNDEVGKALDDFKLKVEPHTSKENSRRTSQATTSGASSSLLDLETNLTPHLTTSGSCDSHLLTGDDVLMLGGGGTPLLTAKRIAKSENSGQQSSRNEDLNDIFGAGNLKTENLAPTISQNETSSTSKPKGLLDLDALSEALIQQNLPTGLSSTNQQTQAKKLSLQQLLIDNNNAKSSQGLVSMSPLEAVDFLAGESAAASTSVSSKTAHQRLPPPTPHTTPQVSHCGSPLPSSHHLATENPKVYNTSHSLDDVFVTLDSVKPSSKESITVLNRFSIKILMHYTSNKPLADVTCVLFSISSSNIDHPLLDVKFTVRVLSSSSRIKMQPPNGDSLPAFNPLLPPNAISQILLIQSKNRVNRLTENIPVDYTLTYRINGEEKTIDGFTEIDCS